MTLGEKKLRFKIEENPGKEFTSSNQAEIWIWIPLVSSDGSGDKIIGYFYWFWSFFFFFLSML